MEIGWLTKKRYRYLVPAPICAVSGMKRLMQIADYVNDEAQRQLPIGKGRLFISNDGRKMRKGGDRIALRWRGNVHITMASRDCDIVPWTCCPLPKWAGVCAARPVR